MTRRMFALILAVAAWWVLPEGSPPLARADASPDTAEAGAATAGTPATGQVPGGGRAAGPVYVLPVDDIIGPISARYISEAIAEAEADRAEVLVLELDTPGGLMTSMHDIIKGILASEVPVCVYVAPQGARAASAGTFITIAAHVAAMAPGTNIGAASPVNTGGEMDSTLARKVFQDATASIRSLARLRGRNEAWAASAVDSARSVPAEEAVKLHIVDFLAADRAELLRKMDGRTVAVSGDSAHVIRTGGAVISERKVMWRWRALSLLNDPTVAYLLLMLGFYGLFFELSNPGVIFPGVMGGICLILGLIGLQTLSLNYAGLLLLVLGMVLFFLETQVTSHGVLGLGGAVSLLAGSLLLFDSPEPFLRVSLQVALPTVLLSVGFFAFAITLALRAQRRRVVSGKEGLLGLHGEVRRALVPRGAVFVAGEHWSAVSETGESLPEGTDVEVAGVDHLLLTVRRAPGPASFPSDSKGE